MFTIAAFLMGGAAALILASWRWYSGRRTDPALSTPAAVQVPVPEEQIIEQRFIAAAEKSILQQEVVDRAETALRAARDRLSSSQGEMGALLEKLLCALQVLHRREDELKCVRAELMELKGEHYVERRWVRFLAERQQALGGR